MKKLTQITTNYNTKINQLKVTPSKLHQFRASNLEKRMNIKTKIN